MPITKKIDWPFDQYRWTWAGLMPQENLKRPSTYLSVLRVLLRYEGLPHTEGKIRDELLSDLEALQIQNVDGQQMNIRRADGTNVLLRNDQVYWTSIGAMLPTKLAAGNIRITPLGKALALGRITLANHAQLMCNRLQLPNPAILDTKEKYEEWSSNKVFLHPLAILLKVLISLHKSGGIGNAYIAEQELGAIIIPIAPRETPSEMADAIIRIRAGSLSPAFFPSRCLVKDDGKELRVAKEFLQYLSICGFLISAEQTVKCISKNGDSEWCKLATIKARCYYLNTLGAGRDSRFGELSDSDRLLENYESIADAGIAAPFFGLPNQSSQNTLGIEGSYESFRLAYCEYLGSYELTPTTLSHVTDTSLAKVAETLRRKKQVILYGPPGTGKTRMAIEVKDFVLGSDARERGRMIQFHQNYGYDDFVEGIRPVISKENESSTMAFSYKDGIFKKMILEAIDNQDREYVLIIDEINRGNLASIFGDLIMLLEESYRNPDSAIRLPYTGDSIYIPKNLYLLGTMNSTDKTAIDLDLALRRRFHFIRLKPDISILERELASAQADHIPLPGGAIVKPSEVLSGLNKLIAQDRNLGNDFKIGHSYFLPLMKNPSAEMLLELFGGEILPLLEEYLLHSPGLGAQLKDTGLDVDGSSINIPVGEAFTHVMQNLSKSSFWTLIMPHIVEARSWQTLDLDLSVEESKAIEKLATNRALWKRLTPRGSKAFEPLLSINQIHNGDRINLTIGPYVGTLKIADLEIKILPPLWFSNVTLTHILLMLLASYGLEPKHEILEELDTDFGVSSFGFDEILYRVFTKSLILAIRSHKYYDYQDLEKTSSRLVGKILWKKQSTFLASGKAAFAIKHGFFTDSNPINETLCEACRLVKLRTRLDENFQTAQTCQVLMGASSISHELGGTLPRRAIYLKESLALASLIIHGQSQSEETDDLSLYGYAINLFDLFEKYVSSLLVNQSDDYQVQKPFALTLDSNSLSLEQVSFYPDIVLADAAGIHAILDAKCKNLISRPPENADIYQIYTYSVSQGLDFGILIYPLARPIANDSIVTYKLKLGFAEAFDLTCYGLPIALYLPQWDIQRKRSAKSLHDFVKNLALRRSPTSLTSLREAGHA